MNSALERTRATRPTLRKSEAKVADLVLADPARILESSLAGVAELAGVSEPTVIRFCVALGYSGFQEFKLRFAQSLVLGRSAIHSVISDRDGLDATRARGGVSAESRLAGFARRREKGSFQTPKRIGHVNEKKNSLALPSIIRLN